MVSAEAFIKQCYIPLNEGWGYIYGTWGSLWTAEKQAKATRDMTVKYGSKWIGKMVTDCSGLLRWALYQLGESIVHHARYQYTDYCRNKGKLINGLREDGSSILPGTAVFLQGKEDKIHHVGVYVGDNTCIEAKGTVYGVVTSELSHWDHWGELIMVDYSGETPVTPDRPEDVLFRAVVDNPNTWLNVRSGPGMQYPLRFQVHKDSTVDVLATEQEWWQIRYGGQIGWAFAKYLSTIEAPEEPDQPEEPETPEPDAGSIAISPDDLNELISISNRLNDLLAKIGGYVG
jgi:cell wall-associated NlpC family hydrolase